MAVCYELKTGLKFIATIARTIRGLPREGEKRYSSQEWIGQCSGGKLRDGPGRGSQGAGKRKGEELRGGVCLLRKPVDRNRCSLYSLLHCRKTIIFLLLFCFDQSKHAAFTH